MSAASPENCDHPEGWVWRTHDGAIICPVCHHIDGYLAGGLVAGDGK